MSTIYLDHAATTPPLKEVYEAMKPFISYEFGNPSSIYSIGKKARAAVEHARRQVAELIGAKPGEIVFTSGGTESDNLALVGGAFAWKEKGNHIVTTAIEHHAVLESCRFLKRIGFDLSIVGVDSSGIVDPDDIRKAIKKDTVMVSVMHANNEVGTIQPVAEISKICREREVYLHTDAIQSVGNVPVNVQELGVDMLSVSAHKIYGPKGVGALYVREGCIVERLIHGGEQEKGLRAGTENVPGIIGLGVAARAANSGLEQRAKRIAFFRDTLIDGVLSTIPGVYLNGHRQERLPNNVHFCFDGVEGEAVCLHLDAAGICASTGSACSSGALEPSHVLLAMGVGYELAQGSVRFTLGRDNTIEEIHHLIEILPPIIARLRAMSPGGYYRPGTCANSLCNRGTEK